MIYLFIIFIGILTHETHTQWSSTAAKDLKQPVNFAGKITTHQGQEFVVDNISIHGKYSKIPMPLKPENLPEPTLNTETKQYDVTLNANPTIDFPKRDIDLDEISEIKVSSPNTIYVYQKKERSQKLEFLEVEIISKSGTKYYYLLESKTPIYGDTIDSAGPQETTIPLSALKTLTIDGYTYRDTNADKKKKCKQTDCPPCQQKTP